MKRITDYSRKVLNLFYTNRCTICGCVIGSNERICEDCNDIYQPRYRRWNISGLECYSACYYEDKNKLIVLGAKNNRDGAKLDFMAYEIYCCLEYFGILDTADCFVPVPMYYSDVIKRGYNQTEKICAELSRLSGIKSIKALKKIRRTRQQKALSASERQLNLKDCYAICSKADISGKTIVVIDDVSTTGATFKEIDRLLRYIDCKRVVYACFAKTEKGCD